MNIKKEKPKAGQEVSEGGAGAPDSQRAVAYVLDGLEEVFPE